MPGAPECRALRRGSTSLPSLRTSQSMGSRIGGGGAEDLSLVRQAAHQANARREFLQQFDGARQAAHGVGRVLRFFEAHGGVGAQLQRGGSLAHAGGVEASRFRARCAWCPSTMALSMPPITPASAMAPAASAITRFDGLERVFLVVQRAANRSPARARRMKMVSPCSWSAIEGVHGLRQLRHDVVGHVDDVVDGVQPDGGEPVLQPERRRPHGDVFEHQRAVSRAQIQIFDRDLDRRGPAGQQRTASPDRAAACRRMAATSRAMP